MACAEELDISKEPTRKLCTEVPHKKTPYDYCDNGKGEGRGRIKPSLGLSYKMYCRWFLFLVYVPQAIGKKTEQQRQKLGTGIDSTHFSPWMWRRKCGDTVLEHALPTLLLLSLILVLFACHKVTHIHCPIWLSWWWMYICIFRQPTSYFWFSPFTNPDIFCLILTLRAIFSSLPLWIYFLCRQNEDTLSPVDPLHWVC